MLGEIVATARLVTAAHEAYRRDRADAAKLRDTGWSVDEHGGWRNDAGGHLPEGPGTHTALAKHFGDVVRERGLSDDVALVGAGVRRILASIQAQGATAPAASSATVPAKRDDSAS